MILKPLFLNLILLVSVGLWHLKKKNLPGDSPVSLEWRTPWSSILQKVEALPLKFLWGCLLRHHVWVPCVSSFGSCLTRAPLAILLVTTQTYNASTPFIGSSFPQWDLREGTLRKYLLTTLAFCPPKISTHGWQCWLSFIKGLKWF